MFHCQMGVCWVCCSQLGSAWLLRTVGHQEVPFTVHRHRLLVKGFVLCLVALYPVLIVSFIEYTRFCMQVRLLYIYMVMQLCTYVISINGCWVLSCQPCKVPDMSIAWSKYMTAVCLVYFEILWMPVSWGWIQQSARSCVGYCFLK